MGPCAGQPRTFSAFNPRIFLRVSRHLPLLSYFFKSHVLCFTSQFHCASLSSLKYLSRGLTCPLLTVHLWGHFPLNKTSWGQYSGTHSSGLYTLVLFCPPLPTTFSSSSFLPFLSPSLFLLRSFFPILCRWHYKVTLMAYTSQGL